MAKIELLYPNQTDLLLRYNRFDNPEYFFHMTYFDKQLYVIKSGNYYKVKSMNYVPTFIKHLDVRYITSHVYLELYKSQEFKCAIFMFQKACQDLLYTQNCAYLSEFDIDALTPIKYPKEVNLIRKVFC